MLKKIILWMFTAALVLGGTVFAWLWFRTPSSRPASQIKVAMTPERIERGRYIFTLADCDGCHSPADETKLYRPFIPAKRASGQFLAVDDLPGKVYPPNLTPDPETGLGQWTDGEKIRAIREGIGRDGRALFPMMPYTGYRHMSDEDVESLVAFLNTLAPVRNQLPKTEIAFPVNLLIKGEPRPVTEPVATPTKANPRVYGEYLVTIGGCSDCHTPQEKGSPIMTKRLAGGMAFKVNGGQYQVVSANITPDPETGIGNWTQDYFLERVRRHRNVPVEALPAVSPDLFTLMPWRNMAQLPDDDLVLIYQYLRTVVPITNKVIIHPGVPNAPRP